LISSFVWVGWLAVELQVSVVLRCARALAATSLRQFVAGSGRAGIVPSSGFQIHASSSLSTSSASSAL
jgi:hypothetical protein